MKPMEKGIIAYVLLIFLATPIVLAESSLKMKSTISENVQVVFEFTEIEQQLYNDIQAHGIFNASTIPKAIEKYLEQKELKNAWVIHDPFQKIFNDERRSIRVKFLLAGSDVISYTLNKTEMTRTFKVRTDWRNFKVDFTQNFSISFEEHFKAPLSEWQLSKRTFEKISNENGLKLAFRFVLPEEAYNIQAEEDIIVFKVALAFEDSLLNSPFLILAAIIATNLIVLVYRKAGR